MVDLGTRRPGEIDRVGVPEDHQGNSIATSMFDFAKQHEPRLHHSETLTEDGRGWSEYEKARHAAVTQSLVDRLHGEFKDWRKKQPRGSIFGGGVIGGLNEWTNIEKFLHDHYPAAHRGLRQGHEEAKTLLDWDKMFPNDDPEGPYSWSWARYDTGPQAVEKHGYDPKEIAAGMLLLHNKSDRFRGDMSHEDQARLNDIAQKRYQMQRNYEQRKVTAGKNGPLPPLTFEPFNTMWSNGIMARHAEDGRPVGHLHWIPNGEIDSITVHPELQRRGIGQAMLGHARANPDDYRSAYRIYHSQHLTNAGQAWAAADGHHPPPETVYRADENPDNWGWKPVDRYTSLAGRYNGENEDEMSNHLDQTWTPPTRTASLDDDEGWPVWWNGRHRPAGPFDGRWSPNHPQRIPAPWES